MLLELELLPDISASRMGVLGEIESDRPGREMVQPQGTSLCTVAYIVWLKMYPNHVSGFSFRVAEALQGWP